MAAGQRWRTTRDPRFLRFLEDQAVVFLDRLAARLPAGNNNCADIEGAVAALGALEGAGRRDEPPAQRLRTWTEQQEALVPALQIGRGQMGLAFAGQAQLAAPRMAQFAGAFLMGRYAPVTRIDTDMHCVAALLALERNPQATDK